MKTDPAILAAVRAEMARHRVRQRDLAQRLGVNQQAMSNRLCGITPLSAREIAIIADEIGCPLSDLIGESISARAGREAADKADLSPNYLVDKAIEGMERHV